MAVQWCIDIDYPSMMKSLNINTEYRNLQSQAFYISVSFEVTWSLEGKKWISAEYWKLFNIQHVYWCTDSIWKLNIFQPLKLCFFLSLSFSLSAPVTFLTEGVLLGFWNFACEFNSQKNRFEVKNYFGELEFTTIAP